MFVKCYFKKGRKVKCSLLCLSDLSFFPSTLEYLQKYTILATISLPEQEKYEQTRIGCKLKQFMATLLITCRGSFGEIKSDRHRSGEKPKTLDAAAKCSNVSVLLPG